MDLPPFWPLTPPLEIEPNVSGELALANEDDGINYNIMMEALELEARDIEDALAVSVSDLQRPIDVDIGYSVIDEVPPTPLLVGDLTRNSLDKYEDSPANEVPSEQQITSLDAEKLSANNNVLSDPLIFTSTKEKLFEEETLEDIQFIDPSDNVATTVTETNDEHIFHLDSFDLNEPSSETQSLHNLSTSPTLESFQVITPFDHDEIKSGHIWSTDNFQKNDASELLNGSQLQFAEFDRMPKQCFISQNNDRIQPKVANNLHIHQDHSTPKPTVFDVNDSQDFSYPAPISDDAIDSSESKLPPNTDEDDFQEFSSSLSKDDKMDLKPNQISNTVTNIPKTNDALLQEPSVPAAEDDFQEFSTSQDYEEFSNYESFPLHSLQTADTIEMSEDIVFCNIADWIVSYKQNIQEIGSKGDGLEEGNGPTLCRFQLGETWKQLLDGDDRQPYLRNWISSFCRQMLLKSINIDPANLLNFNPSFPRFVSTQNLTPAVIAAPIDAIAVTNNDYISPLSTPAEVAPVITLRDSHIFTPANTTLPQVETFQSGELLPQKCEVAASGSSYYMPDFEVFPTQPSVSQTTETEAIHSPQNFEQNILQPTLVIPSVPVVKWPNPGKVKEQGFVDFMTDILPMTDLDKSKTSVSSISANSISSTVHLDQPSNKSKLDSDFGSIFSQDELSTIKPDEQPSPDDFSDFQTADNLTLSTTPQILVPVLVTSVQAPATSKINVAKRTEYEVLRPVALDDRFSPLFSNKTIDVYQSASVNRPVEEDDWSDFVSGPFKAQPVADQDEWTEYIGGGTLPSASSSELRTISGKVSTRLGSRQTDMDLPSLEFSNPNFNKSNDHPRL